MLRALRAHLFHSRLHPLLRNLFGDWDSMLGQLLATRADHALCHLLCQRLHLASCLVHCRLQALATWVRDKVNQRDLA